MAELKTRKHPSRRIADPSAPASTASVDLSTVSAESAPLTPRAPRKEKAFEEVGPPVNQKKVRVKSLVTTKTRYGRCKLDLKEGSTYRVTQEVAKWLKFTGRVI